MNEANTPYHIRLLATELKTRQARNPRYSLRAFSKYLNLDPSSLSRLLSNKQELSLAAYATILQKLELPEEEAGRFISSVAEDKMHKAAQLLANLLVKSQTRCAEAINSHVNAQFGAQAAYPMNQGLGLAPAH
jgi:transcriptional regulator with XRE-family HTH domain